VIAEGTYQNKPTINHASRTAKLVQRQLLVSNNSKSDLEGPSAEAPP